MALFTNQATLTYNDIVINSNVATGELREALSLTKTAVQTTYGAGDTVTYVVSIVNTGTVPFTGLTLTDDLGGYSFGQTTLYPLTAVADSLRYYVNGVLQTTPTVTDTEPLVITGLNTPAGGNAILVYQAAVNPFAPLGAGDTIDNTVTLTGAGVCTPLTATATITAQTAPLLSISKSICPSVVFENDRVTYTFVIQNLGNRAVVATDNATITDIFDPVLTDLVVTFNGASWTEGMSYTYNVATGTFVTALGAITVPAATYTQDPVTGQVVVTPGYSTLTVTGTI